MDAKQTLGEPRLLISRSALLHNARLLRARTGPHVRLCAMIKGDAYGHGAAIVADTLCNFLDPVTRKAPVDEVAVATIEEAIALPELAVPLTVMRPVENVFIGRQRQLLERAILAGWTLTIRSPAAADDLARVAQLCGKRANLHVMVDTGMTRCGADVGELDNLMERVASHAMLKLVSIGTHFANSEVPDDPFTREQLLRFLNVTEPFVSGGAFKHKVIRHAANSGAIFFTSGAHLDAVRPGIAIYGIDPTCKPHLDRPLKPVMKWTAPIVGIHEVQAGTSVGYGRSWQAPHDTRIGLIPVGYADGYLRDYSNKGAMVLDGRACPVVGKVSMDLTTIDLHNVPDASIGDEVTVLDNDPVSPASAYRLAKWADTIPYEVFCRIGPRVTRVAVDPEDAPVDVSQARSEE